MDIETEKPDSKQKETLEFAKGSYQNLNNLISMFYSLQKKDMDAIIPITSDKGFGKTTFALQASKTYIETFYPEKSFLADLEKYVVFDYDEVKDNILNSANDWMPLIPDEAVRFMMSEDWAKTESKDMKKFMTQIRIKHRIIFPCIPNFWWIDRKYREDMVLYWLHIVARGVAILFTKDLSIGIEDKWHRKEFQKLAKKPITMTTDPGTIINIYRRHPCFLDVIIFPKSDIPTYDKYLKIRNEALSRGQDLSNPMVSTIALSGWYRAKGMKINDIAIKLMRPKRTIENWLSKIPKE